LWISQNHPMNEYFTKLRLPAQNTLKEFTVRELF
jgi:hypothetical protein